MSNMVFENEWFLWFELIIPLLILWYVFRQGKNNASLTISSMELFDVRKVSYRHYLRHLLFALRLVAIGLVIVVLARPQNVDKWKSTTSQGIDIVLAIDVSGTMQYEDFTPNRLEAAKNVATQFIAGRPDDRIGLTVFSGESFTQCPVTTDHAVLINLLREVKSGMIEDGTAIGLGLATAINRVKDSDSKSKVVILLTDGLNNRGAIDPITAAEIAKAFNVRVYTIGVGTMGYVDVPVRTWYGMTTQKVPVEIDEALLSKISDMTGGKYFRATDNNSLEKVYQEIDQMEKSKIETKEYSKREEMFMPWAIAAAAIFAIEMLLRLLLLRNIS